MVDVIEPGGSEVILIVTVGEHQLTAKVHPQTKASLHQPIELSVDMNNVHLFDKETGEVMEWSLSSPVGRFFRMRNMCGDRDMN